MRSNDLTQIARMISDRIPNAVQALLVGISGIDASGKSYVAAELAAKLRKSHLNVALLNVDGWLNLPHVRFNDIDPGRHFYENAIRLDEMFQRLVLPLRRRRSLHLVADLVEETATAFHQHEYCFDDINVILVEGIFLFKPRYAGSFDIKIWIDCDTETALQRAVSRSQEGLSPAETIEAYERIYFPAQRIHLGNDQPLAAADIILENGR